MDERVTIANLERRLAESETRQSRLIDSWAQAVWETDAHGVVVTDSPSWCAYTGQTPEEWRGYGWLGAIHPEDRAYAEQQWREAIAVRGLVNAEFRLQSPNGGWRWTNVRAAPVLDAEGAIKKWVGMNIDIDARKHAEAALRDSEERYRSLFNAVSQGLAINRLVRDENGRVIDARFLDLNPAYEAQTGFDRTAAVSRLASDVFPQLEPFWLGMAERVVETRQSERAEEFVAETGRWYAFDMAPFGTRDEFAVLYQDITQRKNAEAARNESEERQSVLLALTDALRPLTQAEEVITRATQILGDYLQADRTFVAEMERDEINMQVYDEYLLNGAPSVIGHHNFDLFGPFVGPILARGEILAVDDIADLSGLTEVERAHYGAVGIAAYLLIPLVRNGRFAACFAINHRTARPWSAADKSMARQTADRTWMAVERSRAEAALRESEERFQQFARASAAGLWIRDAATLAMEFASPAIVAIYGLEAEALLLDDVKRWASMIVPEDRDTALGHLEQARQGRTVAHEFRIQRLSDGAFRWIRHTDFPLRDDGHIPRIGGIAEDVTETRRLAEHQGVLLAELQHRVRNIMGMIRSIANRSAAGAKNVADYRAMLEGRLLALARVQALLTREANAGGSLGSVLENEIAAQAHGQGQYALTGPDIRLSPKAVEVLTLAFHELATNALKYGALSVPDGRLTVTWAALEKRGSPWLALDWTETGAPLHEPSTRRGFGSELIEARIPYELSGRGTITITPEGARCRLEFPLREAESILETDAPQPATTFGGTLDMTGAPDLTGRTVLVVEDDYYMAADTAAALRGAGAKVLGPCPTEEATCDLLADGLPTHAVLDLNLGGGGPRFEIAHLLRARGVPFLFLTGYDPDVIPQDLMEVVRLQKPLPFRDIVEAISLL